MLRMTTGSAVSAAALAAVLGLAAAAPSAQGPVRTADVHERGLTPGDFPRITKLADDVYTYEQIDPTKRVLTVNNLIVISSEGVLVADGQGTIENGRRLVAEIAALTPQPIRYVVIGSEHGDHTGGDAAFPSSATFIAHPFSKANLERQAEAGTGRSSARRVIVPTETVSDRRAIHLGTREVDVLFLGRAHTGGDLVVYLPQEKILYMSEVFSNRVFPSMANAYPSEWIGALKKAEAMAVEIYVPAHGFVDSPDVLQEEERRYRGALEQIFAEGRRLHDAHVPLEEAASRANFDGFDGWTRAANNATTALGRVYLELDGKLP